MDQYRFNYFSFVSLIHDSLYLNGSFCSPDFHRLDPALLSLIKTPTSIFTAESL